MKSAFAYDLLVERLVPPVTRYAGVAVDAPEISLPVDFRWLIARYGAGWVNEYLAIYSPVADAAAMNTFSRTKLFAEVLNELAGSEPRAKRLHSMVTGTAVRCFVWAGTINGETLLSNFVGTDKTSQVILVSSDLDVVEYWCDVVEFMFDLVSQRIKGEFISREFVPPFVYKAAPNM